MLARLGLGVAAGGVLVAALIGGAGAMQARLAPHAGARGERSSTRPADGGRTRSDVAATTYAVRQAGLAGVENADAGGPPRGQSATDRAATRNHTFSTSTEIAYRQPSAGQPSALEASVPRGAPIAPTLQDGRTDFGNGVFAERTGNTVLVHFDTPETRTRRRDKLEHIVRATLPKVYGPALDSALAKIPPGGLTNGHDPVTELTAQGMWIPLDKGWALAVWPQTRPGQDGPLVVTYKAVVMH